MKKRGLLLLIASVLLAMFLAACGSSGSTPGSGSGSGINYSGTITIWHNWQGDYLAAKQKIFDAYTQMHSNVKIVLVHQDTVVDKAITAVNAKQGPDIIAWVDDSLGKLAKSNIVIPLDSYVSADYVNSTYNKAAAEGVTFNGHVYGIPEAVETVTIMYNKALVTPDQLPKTTADLLAFNQKLRQQGKYGVVWNTEDAYFNAGFFYGSGIAYVDNSGNVGLNTPQAISATKYLVSLKPTLPSQISYDVASSLFSEGKAAAIINGPWSVADYQKKAGINIGYATLPMLTYASSNASAKPFVGVKSLWVTKNAKNPALAVDIMKFYSNTQNQVAMSVANGEIPANLAADNDPAVKALPAVAGFAAQAQLGTALPNTPFMSALWKPVADALTAAWTGSQTPEAAMAAAQSAAQKNIQSLQS